MIVDTDAVEACVFAAGSECRDVGQGPADRNSDGDAELGQSIISFNPPLMLHFHDDEG
jgi:hypothetical protein